MQKSYYFLVAFLLAFAGFALATHGGSHPLSEDTGTINTGGPAQGDVKINASTNLTDSSACTNETQCAGGYCVHSLCRSSSTYCGDGFCDSGESCSSDNSACGSGYACTSGCVASTTTTVAAGRAGSGGGGETTTTTTTTIPVSVTTLEKPVEITETKTVNEVINAVPPSSLGVTEVTADGVKVEKVAEASVATSVSAEKVEQAVTQALNTAVSEAAKETLKKIKESLNTASAQSVSVQKTVEVFSVTSKDTGKSTSVSRITLTFSAPNDAKNIMVVEIVPKSVASSVSELVFLGILPTILQADPILQWSYDNVKKGETKDMSYVVKKNLTKIESVTVSAASKPAAPTTTTVTTTTVPAKPPEEVVRDYTILFLLLAVILVAFSLYWFVRHYK